MEKNHSPARIALIYAVFAVLWIMFLNRIANLGYVNPYPWWMQVLRGFLYVGASATLVYGLVLRSSRRIERSRAWYNNLFEHNTQPMWIYDYETLSFMEVNEAAVAQYGFSRSEFLQMTIADIRPQEDISALMKTLEGFQNGIHRPGVWRHKLKNGKLIRVEISAQKIRYSGRPAAMVLAENVTARLDAEESVRATIAFSPLALVNLDSTGRVCEWNASAERIFGWRAEEVMGRALPIVPHEQQFEFVSLLQRVTQGETLSGLETTKQRKDGTLCEVRLSAAPLQRTDGQMPRVLVVLEDVTAQKRAEADLRDAQQRIQLILNSVGESILALDSNGLILGANPAAATTLGCPEEEMVGKDMGVVLRPHLLPGAPASEEPAIFQTLKDGLSRRANDEFFFRQDGSGFPVEYTCSPIVDGAGNVNGTVICFHDISSQLEAEESLRHSQSLLRMASRISRTGAWVADLRVPSLIWSDEVRALHEVPPEFTPTVETALSFYAPEHRTTIKALFEACATQGTPFNEELQIITANGRRVWVRAMGEPVREGRSIVRVQGAIQDISEHKDAEQLLAQSRRRFHQLADSMHLIVWTGEPDGRVTYVNRAYTDITGTPPEVLISGGWFKDMHPDDWDRSMNAWRIASESGTTYEVEFRLRGALYGDYRWHLARAVPLRDENGEIIKWNGTTLDIHETKQAEERANRWAERLTTTLESITDAFFTVDSEMVFTYVNGEAEKVLQRKREELIGKSLWDEFPASRGTLFEQEYLRALETGVTSAFDALYEPLKAWFAVKAYPSEAGLAVYFRDITKRRKEREALKANEERLRMITAATNDAIWEYDPATDHIQWSSGFETLFGYTISEGQTGAFWEEHVHPQERQVIVDGIEQALAGSSFEWSDEYRFRCKDGHYAYVLDSGRIQRDMNGKAVRMIGGISDLTQRALAEAALRESELRLRESERQMAALLDNFPGMAYRCRLDSHWTMLFTSQGAISLTGYEPEELLNNNVVSYASLILPQQRDRVFREVRRSVELGAAFELEYGIRMKDGRERCVWERGRYFKGEDGQEGHLEGFIMDVTDRKHAEEERERLKAAIDQLAEIVLITDPEGTIQYVNPAFERVTGYTREEAIGQNPRFLKSGEQNDAYFKSMYQTLNAGRTWRGRMVNKRKDLTRFTEDSIISPVLDAQGALVHYVCVKNDVTSQLILEEQYRQAQKMEAVGRLAGGVAHDFNNMLTVILVRAEVALRRLNPEDPAMGRLIRPLNDIHQAAERSAELTRQLLTYARRQTVEPRLLSLNEAVDGMLKMLRRLIGENIELAWIPTETLWQVQIDPVQIDQMLANLTVNARDSIENVGKITIETHNTEIDEAFCLGRPGFVPGEYVMLAVSDNGCGMDKETLSHIFEPFFTTKEVGKGTGLGLATVYGIVKQNNGFVHVYSEIGEGTTFRVYLPRQVQGDRQNAGQKDEFVPPPALGETILLVEDEPMIREATAEILQGLGYQVLEAGAPVRAMEVAANHPGKIDLLLTDVIMPEMNGRELAEELRNARADIKCLFMSGYTANVIVHRGIADLEAAFIQKPFSTTALALKIREVLEAELPG